MAAISAKTLNNMLFGNKPQLIITPILDKEEQIAGNSVDVRLGNEFIIIKRSEIGILDPVKSLEVMNEIEQYQRKIHVPYGSNFILHPHEFVLAATLEYLSVPPTIMGYVVGRSSWGRLGLIIAAATSIRPGYKGIVTLELANLGNIPITLYPCIRIAQLIFHTSK